MSKPVFLYLFERGTQQWRRAASSRAITALGYVWPASPIDCSDVEMTGEAERDQVKITLPISDEFAADCVKNIPEKTTTLTIYRLEQSDNSYEYWWSGRVTMPEVTNGIVTIPCDPDNAGLARATRPRIFMRQCPHSIYFGECRLNKADWLITAGLVSVAGATITVSGLDGVESGALTGGIIEAHDGSTRAIKVHNGNTLTLVRELKPLKKDIASSTPTVKLYPGCGNGPSGCASFGNIANYGGFMWMLTGDNNPFAGSSSL